MPKEVINLKTIGEGLSGETLLAISSYYALLKAEKRVEKLNGELASASKAIPENEITKYHIITKALDRKVDNVK